MQYCECFMCRKYEYDGPFECNYVSKCPSFVRDKPDKSEYFTYCARTPLKLRIDGMEKACRFGYCDCHIGTKYEDRNVEYCYLCDDFKEGKE